MTDQVPENNRRDRYIVTNPAGQSVFDIGFPIVSFKDENGNLVSPVTVYVNGIATNAYSIHYGDLTLELDTLAAQDDIVVIEGTRPIKRTAGYPLGGGLSSKLLNDDADAVVQMLQEMHRDVTRGLILNKAEGDDVSTQLPLYQSGYILGWDIVTKKLVNSVSYAAIMAVIPNAEAAATAAANALLTYQATVLERQAAQAAAAETEADRQAVAAALETVNFGPSTPKVQIFTTGFTAGVTTVLPALTNTPLPVNEESFDIFFYNGTTFLSSPAPDRYSYNNVTGVTTLTDVVPATTTKIVYKWWTSLNIGTPADNSTNWLTKIISAGSSKIAAWAANGSATVLDFVTAIGGAPTDTEIPTAKAVIDYFTATLATLPNVVAGAAGKHIDAAMLRNYITSWVAFTPTITGFGTPTSIACFSRRVGDTLEVQGYFVSGSPTGVEAQITFGFNGTDGNVTSDPAKLPPIASSAGTCVTTNAGTGFNAAALIEGNKTYICLGLQANVTGALTKANANLIVVTGNGVSFNVRIPITGW